MKTLKYEECCATNTRPSRARLFDPRVSGKDLHEKAAAFALGYMPPARFEKEAATRRLLYEFLSIRNLPSDGGASPAATPRFIGLAS